MREDVINRIERTKLICIVRGVYGEDCLKLAEALCKGGIELLEVTFDQSHPESLSRTSDTVKLLVRELGDKMDFGAGTVTSLEMLELAREAGASFIVSPNTDETVIRKTREYGLVSLPGAMTPSEIVDAAHFGADFVKVFPAGVLGPDYFKAVLAPLNNIRLLAVGGVSEKNIAAYLKAGAAGAGCGGNLVNKEWIKAGEFDKITELAEAFCREVRG